MLNYLSSKYMKYNYILGIDISKKTIDVALSQNQASASMVTHKFTNNPTGYQALVDWLKKQDLQEMEQLLVCLENTGIYHRCLVTFLQSQRACVWIENAVTIKWSGGLQRGKSDKLDAQRICLYAFRNQDKAKIYAPIDKALQQVNDLSTTRQRLIQAKISLQTPIKELREVGLEQEANMLQEACKKSIASLEAEIKAIQAQIEKSIDQQADLRSTYQIIRSVPGIGLVTALHLLVYTHNFKRFASAKQLASYAGVAPFPYSSGSSVRGRTKVHPMANKTLKACLHMCALSSIRNNKEVEQYYEKKVQEGKNKMSVLNAIRNKILHRVYACVKNQKMYEANYLCKHVA
jgi:transposase